MDFGQLSGFRAGQGSLVQCWVHFLHKKSEKMKTFQLTAIKLLAFLHHKTQRGTTFSDMDAGRLHFLGSQRVELKARPFFLLALRAGRPREVGFY